MSRSVGLRIGIVLANFDSESIQLAVEADRLGVDSVWVPEVWMYDALTPLAFLAAKTERIRLGTGTVQLGIHVRRRCSPCRHWRCRSCRVGGLCLVSVPAGRR